MVLINIYLFDMYLLTRVDRSEYDPVPHHHIVTVGAQLRGRSGLSVSTQIN